jgi:hypothetical protein
MKKDTSEMGAEEYAIYLVNSINSGGPFLDSSVVLAAAEIDRLLKVLGTIKGMSKISKISYFKKVKKYLEDM